MATNKIICCETCVGCFNTDASQHPYEFDWKFGKSPRQLIEFLAVVWYVKPLEMCWWSFWQNSIRFLLNETALLFRRMPCAVNVKQIHSLCIENVNNLLFLCIAFDYIYMIYWLHFWNKQSQRYTLLAHGSLYALASSKWCCYANPIMRCFDLLLGCVTGFAWFVLTLSLRNIVELIHNILKWSNRRLWRIESPL